VACVLGLSAACFWETTGPGESPLVDLANRLYLAGEWAWVDSMAYAAYVPADDSVAHRGLYVVSGTATLDEVDSAEVETYVLTATAQIEHADSVDAQEIVSWLIENLEFEDTVEVRGDTIFGLDVEPIPPEAKPTTSQIDWLFQSDQLWCSNWLTDTIPQGNADSCSTKVSWRRTDGAAPPGGTP
jgi:hypothetical protein